MGLTRKALSAMGIEAEKIDQIIEMHTEVVDALKSERDSAKDEAKKYKADSDKLAATQKELDELKAQSGNDAYKEKYEKVKSEYDAYKGEITAKETKAAKSTAYRDMLKEIGISDKRLDAVLKVADLDSIELDDEGKIKDVDNLKKNAKEEWAEFIETKGTQGAKTPTPPAGNGGGSTLTKDQIMNIKDAEARQKAMLENPDMFGI